MSAGAAVTAEQAVRMHQAGDIAGAASAYRALLEKNPRDAQLLNLLGVALLQLGNPTEAVALLREAARRRPDASDIHDNLGSALRAAGHPAPAVESHRRALKIRPGHAPYLFNLGNALAGMGTHLLAIDAYRRSLDARPGHGGALFNLANSQRSTGDLVGAKATYRELLKADPNHAQAWNNLGAVLAQEGELADAEQAYRKSATIRPGHAETLSNLGNVLVERGKLGEALGFHRAAVDAAPESAEALIFLGVALQELDHIDAAIDAYRLGLRLEPDNLSGLTNLGAALELSGRLAEAEAVLSQALAMAPGSADVWGNIGLCRLAQGDRSRGLSALDRALEIDPDLPRVRISRALLSLEEGRLQDGWADYAWRFAAGEALPDRHFAVPAWRGNNLPDKKLLIWREQGLGDELMFASFYAHAITKVSAATIECDPRLVGLFTRSFPTAVVRAQTLPPDGIDAPERTDADFHVPAGELPGLLSPVSVSGFSGAPYLVVDRARSAKAREWLDSLPAGLKIGICWRSRLVTTRRRHNYASVSEWVPLLGVPGIQVVNLQYTARSDEIDVLQAEGFRLHAMPELDLSDDLEGVAALIANLDLVITAPTAVGEIAGAVGTPVWRLVGDRDWSTLGTGTRPWFSSMRLFLHSSGAAAGVREVIRFLKRILSSHG